jgi:hypothetical protein
MQLQNLTGAILSPLLGVKRTSQTQAVMSAYDPSATLALQRNSASRR